MKLPAVAHGRAAGAVLGLTFLLAVAAPWFSPREPDLQEDVAGARLLPPLTRASAIQLDPEHVWIVIGLSHTSLGWQGWRAGRRVQLADGQVADPPSPRFYLLGTDALGRDLASRVFHGVRHSVLVAGASVALALLLGAGVGAASGLAGGFKGLLLMRGVDVLLAVPRLLLFLLFAALFRPSFALLMLVLGGSTWPGLARLVRAEMLALKQSALSHSARATGCSPLRTAVRHLLPQVAPVIAVTAALRFADTILLESALSFLGLGVPPPTVSLGSVIAAGRDNLADGWWVVAWPAAVIAFLVVTVRSTVSGLFRSPEPPSVA